MRSGLYRFGMGNFRDQWQNAQPHGAVAREIAAAGAQDLAEFLRIQVELMIDALPLAAALVAARVMPAGMQREERKLAGVPIARPHARARVALIHDVEAVAHRAGVGAGAARQASQRMLLPE